MDTGLGAEERMKEKTDVTERERESTNKQIKGQKVWNEVRRVKERIGCLEWKERAKEGTVGLEQRE